MPSRVTSCPNCGGQVEFKAGTSLLAVCPYCSSAVARIGDDIGELEILGEVAPLAHLSTPLALGAFGKYRKKPFMLVGQIQYDHGAGPWNEWYAAFDDGRWGWIAEAQGRIYLSFGTEVAGLPRYNEARVGGRFQAGQHTLTITEKQQAKFVAAQGELPFAVQPGTSFSYADLQGEGKIFGTIDYGQSNEPEMLFLGEELEYTDLFDKSALSYIPEGQAAAAVGMNCPNCGSGIELKAPDEAMTVTCSACESVLDCAGGSELKLLSSAKARGLEPQIALGSEGRLKGAKWTIYGHLTRSVSYDGAKYFWEEYLLHNDKQGYRWLSASDNHWSFIEPVSAGDVELEGANAVYQDQRYRHYSSSSAKVEALRGEFYWKVAVGDRVGTSDYVAVPHMLSREMTSQEISWSRAEYISKAELQKAFRLRKALASPSGVAPHQPNPHKQGIKHLLGLGAVFSLALVLLSVVMAYTSQEKAVFDREFLLSPSKVQGKNRSWVKGEPLSIGGEDFVMLKERANLAVKLTSDVTDGWLYVSGKLVDGVTGQNYPFGIELLYSSGYSGGSSWSRGLRSKTVYLGDVPSGAYRIHLNPEWTKGRKQPTRIHIVAKSDVFIGSHAMVVFFILWIVPLIGAIRYYSFEKRRWADADSADWD